ncbi:MAG: DUF6089 family protein, partial [Cyanobacteria bacterium J06649_11]
MFGVIATIPKNFYAFPKHITFIGDIHLNKFTHTIIQQMLKHLLLSASLLCCFSLFGQQEYPWEFGFSVGTAAMGSDISPNEAVFLNEQSIGLGIMVRRRLGGIIALRAHLMYGGLMNDDANSDEAARNARGFSSETSIIEPGLALELEPLANKRFGADGTFKKILSPYVFAGVGYGIWQEAELDFNGRTNAGIESDLSTNEGNSGLVIPAGAGLKWYLSPKTSLDLSASARILSDDRLEGISAAANPDNN